MTVKTFKLFSMAALALVMAACSNDGELDLQPAQQDKIPFIATIPAPNSNATTRTTYTESGDQINVTWKVGDKIALVHNTIKDVATVTAVDGSGNATITATITGSPNDGDDIVLVYPEDYVQGVTGVTNYTPAAHLAAQLYNQEGTLDYIQKYLDLREGAGKLAVGGAGASLKPSVKMDSKLAIWKLTLCENGINVDGINTVEVWVGEVCEVDALTETSFSGGVVYLGLIPSWMGTGDLTIKAYLDNSATCTYTKVGGVSFTAGKYYQSTVNMTGED